jgi:hypothetical protein
MNRRSFLAAIGVLPFAMNAGFAASDPVTTVIGIDGGADPSCTLTLSLDAAPLYAALREFGSLLSELPKDLVPGLVEVIHRPLGLCMIERDMGSAAFAGHSRLVMKPSERFLMVMAAARAGKVDRGFVENLLGHDSGSVGLVRTSNEDRAPVGSQGLAGAHPRNPREGVI